MAVTVSGFVYKCELIANSKYQSAKHSIIELTFPFNNQLDALIIQIYSVKNSTCFWQLFCPLSDVLYCTIGTGKFHAGFDGHLQEESG